MRSTVAALTVLAALSAVMALPSAPVEAAIPTTCAGRTATITGTAGADTIMGTAGPDVIVGLGGNDRIRASGGNDVICGGPGRDAISGGGGDDLINGGSGRDRLSGNVGSDVIIGGAGADVLRGGAGRDRLGGGSGRDYCSAAASIRRCETGPGVPTPPPEPDGPPVERVIHLSLDGLRPDAITPAAMPNLSELVDRGASTLNARTDPALTRTLPNHTSQLTGRPVAGGAGHGVTYNEDQGRTVHDEAGEYVASVFDVVHDHGGRTGAWVSKTKFDAIDRSWNEINGAADLVGVDDGRDKLDVYERADPLVAVERFLDEFTTADVVYSFIHVRSPDEFGHTFGWNTPGYGEGVAEADDVLGRIMQVVDTEPEMAESTAIIVTSDHGGPTDSTNHGNELDASNYTIPFVVWAPGAEPGADLYTLNQAARPDPGVGRPGLVGPQPIRGHDVANLALSLLGLPSVPGSTFNADQQLRIG